MLPVDHDMRFRRKKYCILVVMSRLHLVRIFVQPAIGRSQDGPGVKSLLG